MLKMLPKDSLFSSKILLLFLCGLLGSCSVDNPEVSKTEEHTVDQEEIEDSSVTVIEVKPNGIDLFIDSMRTSNYLLDTNRIKQTIWSSIVKNPTSVQNGHQVIEVPFPVEKFQKHFTNPRTYFFAKWNKEEETFKNGNDYLLMTWEIDSTGVLNEKEIYTSLHEFMGNFPAFIFRKSETVYVMCHRLTSASEETMELTSKLRNYIDSSANIYKPFGAN